MRILWCSLLLMGSVVLAPAFAREPKWVALGGTEYATAYFDSANLRTLIDGQKQTWLLVDYSEHGQAPIVRGSVVQTLWILVHFDCAGKRTAMAHQVHTDAKGDVISVDDTLHPYQRVEPQGVPSRALDLACATVKT